jgi:hypothetical protein
VQTLIKLGISVASIIQSYAPITAIIVMECEK